MISTTAFDYINLLDKAADASWARNDCIANNIANQDTPGYKRQDVSFETEFKKALKISKYSGELSKRISLDAQVSHLNYRRLEPEIYTDNSGFSYRLDGNNVDPDTEGVYLAENQLKYEGLITSINNEFENLQRVMK